MMASSLSSQQRTNLLQLHQQLSSHSANGNNDNMMTGAPTIRPPAVTALNRLVQRPAPHPQRQRQQQKSLSSTSQDRGDTSLSETRQRHSPAAVDPSAASKGAKAAAAASSRTLGVDPIVFASSAIKPVVRMTDNVRDVVAPVPTGANGTPHTSRSASLDSAADSAGKPAPAAREKKKSLSAAPAQRQPVVRPKPMGVEALGLVPTPRASRPTRVTGAAAAMPVGRSAAAAAALQRTTTGPRATTQPALQRAGQSQPGVALPQPTAKDEKPGQQQPPAQGAAPAPAAADGSQAQRGEAAASVIVPVPPAGGLAAPVVKEASVPKPLLPALTHQQPQQQQVHVTAQAHVVDQPSQQQQVIHHHVQATQWSQSDSLRQHVGEPSYQQVPQWQQQQQQPEYLTRAPVSHYLTPVASVDSIALSRASAEQQQQQLAQFTTTATPISTFSPISTTAQSGTDASSYYATEGMVAPPPTMVWFQAPSTPLLPPPPPPTPVEGVYFMQPSQPTASWVEYPPAVQQVQPTQFQQQFQQQPMYDMNTGGAVYYNTNGGMMGSNYGTYNYFPAVDPYSQGMQIPQQQQQQPMYYNMGSAPTYDGSTQPLLPSFVAQPLPIPGMNGAIGGTGVVGDGVVWNF
jgi:hypothetical protein